MRNKLIITIFLTTICGIIYSCQSETERAYSQYLSGGKDIYNTYCKTCHGDNGEGLGKLAPPLTDTVYLKNNKANLACIIKNGSNTPMLIHGKTYEGKMNAFKLADIDIAKVIVYITNNFGNKQGMYTYGQVQQDLQQCIP
jgi:mono/diheme cytochrome c family protein